MSDEKGSRAGALWSSGNVREKAERRTPFEREPQTDYVDPREYKAFELRDNAARLEIRRATQPSRFPAYSYLLDISYDRFHQSAFALVYTFMVVTVNGRNLEKVVHAINFGDCDAITEFDPKRHEKPAKGEPLIESIDIVTADEKIDAEMAR